MEPFVSAASLLRFVLLLAVASACSGPSPSIDVSPGEADDDQGKADGASSTKAELKATIDAGDIRRARYRLGLLNADSETRRIWFYDTPWLEMYDAGVILRAREIDGDDDDSTVKLRPFSMNELATRFRSLDDLKCEIDRDLDSESMACSLKADQVEGQIVDVGAGLHQVRTLFSSEQEDLIATHGPGLTPTDCDRSVRFPRGYGRFARASCRRRSPPSSGTCRTARRCSSCR